MHGAQPPRSLRLNCGCWRRYNPKWPSARDVSRERFYNYLGWLQLAAYECVFVHLWASGKLSYHRGFFTDEAGDEPGGFSAQLTAYHVLQIILVPCASPPPELCKSRG